MKNIIEYFKRTIIVVIPFWIVYYIFFSIYNKDFNCFLWNETQRGNLMSWGILLFVLSFIFSSIHFHNDKD